MPSLEYNVHVPTVENKRTSKKKQLHDSVVMTYIGDILLATETIQDHLVKSLEVFECLGEADFKRHAEKWNSKRSETNKLGQLISAEGIKPDPEAFNKIRDWIPPRDKEELQSCIGFANYYRDFIRINAAKVQQMKQVL